MEQNRENLELILEIKKWSKVIDDEIDLIEYAFLRIFIKFEKFFLQLFVSYASGDRSSSGYIPNRILDFKDSKHLKETTGTRFFNINKELDSLIQNIFEDDNPFSNFFIASQYEFFQKMVILRHYIAHESPESKVKYIKINLNNGTFIEPSQYLKNNVSKGQHISNFSYFVQFVEGFSELCIDGK